MKALAKYGLKNWDRVCRLLPYRTFKAIQNRWFNYLAVLPHAHMKRLRGIYHEKIKNVTAKELEDKRVAKQLQKDQIKEQKLAEQQRVRAEQKEEQ